ncbi:phosphopantothenate--cysteine ligase 2-like [Durio zibethinus]|uniref:Phosphopantothenate--cysteine ligase 2-like n=1 Tax=Durio zibethinus TaxID=66656 RepID=A0A6P5ZFA5_DURZI|nr:phosphopantothenate--cysteine ligase 2-like [Durio zibethinus]
MVKMLRMIALSMRSLGPHAMFYLAAAFSDIYVSWKSLAEHKIQSSSGPLDMRLMQVPKMLSVLRTGWNPMAFCILFKLYRASKILLEKASVLALNKYQMHSVVANELFQSLYCFPSFTVTKSVTNCSNIRQVLKLKGLPILKELIN